MKIYKNQLHFFCLKPLSFSLRGKLNLDHVDLLTLVFHKIDNIKFDYRFKKFHLVVLVQKKQFFFLYVFRRLTNTTHEFYVFGWRIRYTGGSHNTHETISFRWAFVVNVLIDKHNFGDCWCCHSYIRYNKTIPIKKLHNIALLCRKYAFIAELFINI